MRYSALLSIAFIVGVVLPASAEWVQNLERETLEYNLMKFTDCNKVCATELARNVIDGSIDEALDLIASIKAGASEKNKRLRGILIYQFARRTYERGETVISKYGACSRTCDELHRDIVTLGKAGALGPLLKGSGANPAIFSDPKIVGILLKHLKPVDPAKLPWQFHNQNWWKLLERTA